MPEVILPCPACGSDVKISGGDEWHNQHSFFIECQCGVCRVGDTVRAECIDRWNAMPRALRWTHEPPKVAGWYWFSACKGHAVCILVCADGKAKYAKYNFTDAELLGGKWAGPIPAPID